MGKAEILAITGTCPYLLSEKGCTTIACEAAAFKFPDKIARREVIYGFCAHPEAYKNCFFKQVMDRFYYERKFSNEHHKENTEVSGCG